MNRFTSAIPRTSTSRTPTCQRRSHTNNAAASGRNSRQPSACTITLRLRNARQNSSSRVGLDTSAAAKHSQSTANSTNTSTLNTPVAPVTRAAASATLATTTKTAKTLRPGLTEVGAGRVAVALILTPYGRVCRIPTFTGVARSDIRAGVHSGCGFLRSGHLERAAIHTIANDRSRVLLVGDVGH